MSLFSLLKSKPLGPLSGSNQGAQRSQKRTVSPPKGPPQLGNALAIYLGSLSRSYVSPKTLVSN
ncbi:hypothetical protein AMTRI_Chr09g18160 [Amborella trichopoda]